MKQTYKFIKSLLQNTVNYKKNETKKTKAYANLKNYINKKQKIKQNDLKSYFDELSRRPLLQYIGMFSVADVGFQFITGSISALTGGSGEPTSLISLSTTTIAQTLQKIYQSIFDATKLDTSSSIPPAIEEQKFKQKQLYDIKTDLELTKGDLEKKKLVAMKQIEKLKTEIKALPLDGSSFTAIAKERREKELLDCEIHLEDLQTQHTIILAMKENNEKLEKVCRKYERMNLRQQKLINYFTILRNIMLDAEAAKNESLQVKKRAANILKTIDSYLMNSIYEAEESSNEFYKIIKKFEKTGIDADVAIEITSSGDSDDLRGIKSVKHDDIKELTDQIQTFLMMDVKNAENYELKKEYSDILLLGSANGKIKLPVSSSNN